MFLKDFLKGCNMEKEIRIRYNFLLYAARQTAEAAARLRKVTEQLNSDIRVLDETEEFLLEKIKQLTGEDYRDYAFKKSYGKGG